MDADIGGVGGSLGEVGDDHGHVALLGDHGASPVDVALLDPPAGVGVDVADHLEAVGPTESPELVVGEAVEVDAPDQAVGVEVVVDR